MTIEDSYQGASDPSGLEEQTLIRLLGLAGPTDAPELMRRLRADVQTVAAGMKAGLARADRAAMRKHSHVLLAIAGTIGAPRIQALATQLNQCAKDAACVDAQPQAVELMHRLDGLIHRLQSMTVELGLER
ncbi:MAG: hypothetical protein B7Y02_12130 [Rhodobacterales bacterium 17-64-5]|nr:MAG: hypothetical protein B7Y02_12130 [Rhodobacterales bacterium 17-64-5]